MGAAFFQKGGVFRSFLEKVSPKTFIISGCYHPCFFKQSLMESSSRAGTVIFWNHEGCCGLFETCHRQGFYWWVLPRLPLPWCRRCDGKGSPSCQTGKSQRLSGRCGLMTCHQEIVPDHHAMWGHGKRPVRLREACSPAHHGPDHRSCCSSGQYCRHRCWSSGSWGYNGPHCQGSAA